MLKPGENLQYNSNITILENPKATLTWTDLNARVLGRGVLELDTPTGLSRFRIHSDQLFVNSSHDFIWKETKTATLLVKPLSTQELKVVNQKPVKVKPAKEVKVKPEIVIPEKVEKTKKVTKAKAKKVAKTTPKKSVKNIAKKVVKKPAKRGRPKAK